MTGPPPEEGRPLVSVVIPAHNAEGTVAEAVSSVLAQTYRPIEVVVVDDGSTDGTWEVLAGFGSLIRAVRQPNRGIAAARNVSIRASSADLIALMDADDVCEPDRIAVQVACLRAFPDLVLCCSEFSAFTSEGALSARHGAEYYARLRPDQGGLEARFPHSAPLSLDGLEAAGLPPTVRWGQVYEDLALGNFVHPPTVLFRRSVLETAGWFDESIAIMCEWDWLVRVARVGPIGHIDRPLLRYRITPGQVSFSAGAPLDSVHVAERILARDPGLRERHPREVRSLMGGLYADVAVADVEAHHRWAATKLLAKSVFKYGHVDRDVGKILLKILLPSGAIELIKDLAEAILPVI